MYLPLWSIDGKKDNKAIYKKVPCLHICLPVWPALPTYMYLVEIRCAQWHRDDASSYIFPCPVYRIQYLSSSESLIS